MDSLLPPNATQLERDFETVAYRATDLPVPIRDSWNAQTCPAHLLPWLAWAFSVDNWDQQWPEDIKRQVIDAAPELRRLKGTSKAVKLALSQMGFDFEYSEWWQMLPTGTPNTFDITVYINRNLHSNNELLGPGSLSLVRQLIDSNKRATSHYTFNLGLGLDGLLNSTGGIEPVRGDADITIDPVPNDKELPGMLYVSGRLHQHQTLDLTIG